MLRGKQGSSGARTAIPHDVNDYHILEYPHVNSGYERHTGRYTHAAQDGAIMDGLFSYPTL